MYYPYMRGKQYELLTLRESADLIAKSSFSPIIEPVRSSIEGLERCLKILEEKNVEYQIVFNPRNGDFSKPGKGNDLTTWFDKNIQNYKKMVLAYYVDTETTLSDVKNFLEKYKSRNIAIIHFDFQEGKDLGEIVNAYDCVKKHIFFEGTSSRIYQKNFKKSGVTRVIINDGFQKRSRNLDHPEDEHFSDLHIAYNDDLNFDGFGDFLVVGDSFSESGGPAYTVAIHITYFDSEEDMRIKHFKSIESDSTSDPGGKFMQALTLLVEEVNKQNSQLEKTKACLEFLELFNRKHFPGLGVVKKISMNHHLELMANFLDKKAQVS